MTSTCDMLYAIATRRWKYTVEPTRTLLFYSCIVYMYSIDMDINIYYNTLVVHKDTKVCAQWGHNMPLSK